MNTGIDLARIKAYCDEFEEHEIYTSLFVQYASDDLPLLVAEVERLRAEVKRLTPRWQDEPDAEGWYWIEKGGAREAVKIKGKWMLEGAGGLRPLNGRRVAQCTGRPDE